MHFKPLKEENLYIASKSSQKYLVPKCLLQKGSTVVVKFICFMHPYSAKLLNRRPLDSGITYKNIVWHAKKPV